MRKGKRRCFIFRALATCSLLFLLAGPAMADSLYIMGSGGGGGSGTNPTDTGGGGGVAYVGTSATPGGNGAILQPRAAIPGRAVRVEPEACWTQQPLGTVTGPEVAESV